MEPQSAIRRELAQLFEQDQKDHQGGSHRTPEEWQAIQERDRRSRARVRDLMRQGSLASAEEYFQAALILQHGDQAEDFLEAHILFTAAAFKGHVEGRRFSAASLDAFLHAVGLPQRFGATYRQDPGQPVTQEPYDRSLPDTIRREYGVRTLPEQKEYLALRELPVPFSGCLGVNAASDLT